MPARTLRAAVVALAVAACASSQLVAIDQTPRVRVGDGVERPRLVRRVTPVYPADARADGVQGLVILETTIGTDGKVASVDVVRRVDPRLDSAAAEAVAVWEYTPTLLNGEPVEVVMTVNVTFSITKAEGR